MTVGIGLLDLLLSLALVGLAMQVLAAREPFQAVVFFITLGLVMAIVWGRLAAPDIALAEAAIGAGLTGALLLNAIGPLSRRGARSGRNAPSDREVQPPRAAHKRARPDGWPRLATALIVVLGLAVTAYLVRLPTGSERVEGASAPQEGGERAGPSGTMALTVAESLSASGASNPVTAVLLNFRGYDTLLEVGVLLLAAVGAWSVVAQDSRHGARGDNAAMGQAALVEPAQRQADRRAEPVLTALVHLLTPVMVLVAAWLLWQGAKAPGGAFQAAAMLCGAAVLNRAAGLIRPALPEGPLMRWALVVGPFGFLLVGLVLLVVGDGFLTYPKDWAAILILAIEAVLTLSIAAALFALYSAVAPAGAAGSAGAAPSAARVDGTPTAGHGGDSTTSR